MSRYTRREFQEAQIEPDTCDVGPYNESPTAPEIAESYWFACAYHSGYIDGYDSATRSTRETIERTEYLTHEMERGQL